MALRPASPQGRLSVLLDLRWSAPTAAANLHTAHEAVTRLEDRVLKPKLFNERTAGKKILGLAYRLSRVILVDIPLDHMTFLLQHEIFGHGARYREFGFSDNRYALRLFFPYGPGWGRAFPGGLAEGRQVSLDERLAMAGGGSEANHILAQALREEWIERGGIRYHEALLYLLTASDLTAYIWRTKLSAGGSGPNDILNYLNLINSKREASGAPYSTLTLDNLYHKSLWSLLNPLYAFSLFTLVKTYAWSGCQDLTLPFIKIDGIRYLPSLRMGLTPFGPEFVAENFILHGGQTWNILVRFGSDNDRPCYGFGLQAGQLISTPNWSIKGRLDLWKQPPLLLGGTGITPSRGGWGGAYSVDASYGPFSRELPLGAVLVLGYKTTGYVEGEQLRRGWILRAGLFLSRRRGGQP